MCILYTLQAKRLIEKHPGILELYQQLHPISESKTDGDLGVAVTNVETEHAELIDSEMNIVRTYFVVSFNLTSVSFFSFCIALVCVFVSLFTFKSLLILIISR